MQLQIRPISAFKDNYIWLLVDPESRVAVCVDPGDAAPVIEVLQQESLKLTAILITHHHWDHTNGIRKLVETYDPKVYGPADGDIIGLTNTVGENDIVKIPELNLSLKVLEIPGHTLGHIAYYDKQSLFCGDTLFTAGCGRLFEGTAQQMLESLNKLATLPDKTQVYCGHEYTFSNLRFAQAVEPENKDILRRIEEVQNLRKQALPTVPATLAIEKKTNPFLRCEQNSVLMMLEKQTDRKLMGDLEVFSLLRKWKDGFG